MSVRLLTGDCRDVLATLEPESVHTCVTSPPYFGLRDYGVDGQIGLEDTPDAFVQQLVAVFREVRRVLRKDGTVWLNLGDSYNAAGRVGHGTRLGHKQSTNQGSVDAGNARPSVAALKEKDLIGIPWRTAFALQADGWYLRQDIIWAKPNPMPESVTDRCTKSHEYLFLLSKSPRYYYDAAAIAEAAGGTNAHDLTGGNYAAPGQSPQTGTRRAAGNKTLKGKTAYDAGDKRLRTHAGLVDFAGRERAKVEAGDLEATRNRRSVWTVASEPFKEAHFATYPPALIEPCILAGCPLGGTVLDPFGGAGTTGLVADRLQRNAVLIELNPTYAEIARRRLEGDAGMFADVA